MSCRTLISVWIVLMGLTWTAFAESFEDTTIVPLTVDKGFPLQVALTKKLRIERGGSVYATLVEPVYAFDREVIPSGTELEGKNKPKNA